MILRNEDAQKNKPTLLSKGGYPWLLARGSRATHLVSRLPLSREAPPCRLGMPRLVLWFGLRWTVRGRPRPAIPGFPRPWEVAAAVDRRTLALQFQPLFMI